MANDLRGLAYDISAAHKIREKEKDEILRQADEMLEEFGRMRLERRSEIFKMKKEIAGMLSGFRKERERDAAAWRDIIAKMHMKGKKEAAQGRGKKGERPEKSE